MELQQFGTLTIGHDSFDAMACLDADRPYELMLHWWRVGSPAVAALFSIQQNAQGALIAQPMAIYRTTEKGALYPPQLSEDDKKRARDYKVNLCPKTAALDDEWCDNTGVSGSLQLSPRKRPRDLNAHVCGSWAEFKIWASDSRYRHDAVQFRGHGDSRFSLRTSLHRANRHRLERYCFETLRDFKAHAESVLNTRFNLDNGDDYSMLLGLEGVMNLGRVKQPA